jgi:hypothetical protein
VQVLLDHGASSEAKNSKGETPIDLAAGNADILAMFGVAAAPGALDAAAGGGGGGGGGEEGLVPNYLSNPAFFYAGDSIDQRQQLVQETAAQHAQGGVGAMPGAQANANAAAALSRQHYSATSAAQRHGYCGGGGGGGVPGGGGGGVPNGGGGGGGGGGGSGDGSSGSGSGNSGGGGGGGNSGVDFAQMALALMQENAELRASLTAQAAAAAAAVEVQANIAVNASSMAAKAAMNLFDVHVHLGSTVHKVVGVHPASTVQQLYQCVNPLSAEISMMAAMGAPPMRLHGARCACGCVG